MQQRKSTKPPRKQSHFLPIWQVIFKKYMHNGKNQCGRTIAFIFNIQYLINDLHYRNFTCQIFLPLLGDHTKRLFVSYLNAVENWISYITQLYNFKLGFFYCDNYFGPCGNLTTRFSCYIFNAFYNSFK